MKIEELNSILKKQNDKYSEDKISFEKEKDDIIKNTNRKDKEIFDLNEKLNFEIK